MQSRRHFGACGLAAESAVGLVGPVMDSMAGPAADVAVVPEELARAEGDETSVDTALPITAPSSLADVTLLLPDDLLLMVIRDHGSPEHVLSMEAACKRHLRLLHDAPFWAPWTIARFPVLRSILSAAPPCAPDYRALYRMHRQLEGRTSTVKFETFDIQHSSSLSTTGSLPALKTSLEDYVLTTEILSYDDVLSSTSCAASDFVIEREDGASSPAVAKLYMPALWSKETTPAFLAGQMGWSPEQMAAWDMARMAARIFATRVSDLRPLLLYKGAQCAGSSNESYFNKTVLPNEYNERSGLAAAVHLTDDEGAVELAFLKIVPVPHEDGEESAPNRKYILESACLADLLFYFERSFHCAQRTAESGTRCTY